MSRLVAIAMGASLLMMGVAIAGVGLLAERSIDQGRELHKLVNERHEDALQREAENREHSHNAAVNRGINVESWCEGNGHSVSLNGIVNYDRAFVEAATHGQFHYRLADNDCLEIIRLTLESSVHKPHITPTNHPLVYQAMRPR